MESTIIHTWENQGINYTLHSDLTVTSDKPENDVKQIDLDQKSFIANGKLYMIETTISADRWLKQNELEIELGFGMTYVELKNNMVKIYNLTNDRGGRIGDIARISYDSANGISKLLAKEPHIMKFCALFMNTVDEDRRTISDDQIAVKCEDFRKEGIDIRCFFDFALSLQSDLADDYRSHTQNILLQATSMLESQDEK